MKRSGLAGCLLAAFFILSSSAWAEQNPKSQSKETSAKTQLETSVSIVPLPHQTIQNAGINRGAHQSFCETFGLVSDVKQCSGMGCYQEYAKDNRQTNLLPSKVICYQCSKLLSEDGCCPGMPVSADRTRGETCRSKTGVDCFEVRTCDHQCPKDSKLVPGTSLTRQVECCQCSSIASGICDDSGTEQSTSCSEGNLSDLRYSAADASDCSSVVVRGGGMCMAKCVGEGVECGAAH